jgi:hypothetical protein
MIKDKIMKHIILFAGAVALGVAGPALAKPGNGHGNGNGYGHGHGNAYAYGLIGQAYGYGNGGCPPGLAKKNPPCVPPGQAKKLYNVGQRFRMGAASPYAYNQIPYDLRSQYGLNPYNNYYYNNGYLYGVDPRTMVVQQAIAALLR